MLLQNKKFYRPSKSARYLALLDSLADDSSLSQLELGRRANLSGAMVNQYLKELQDKELVKFERVNGKSYRYVLTNGGELRRRHMFAAYSSETVQIYSALKELILGKLEGLSSRGVRDIVLFGASETCEIVLSAIKHTNLRVVALADSDPLKHGQALGGHFITQPQILETLKFQAVVITSFGRQDEIRERLRALTSQQNVEIITL